MDLQEKFISREDIYNGKILHLVKDKVELPNGRTSYREYNIHNGAAAVIPITSEGNVILERQFRYPLGKVIVEVPAGKIDPGEDPFETAKRELTEETGYSAGRYIDFGDYYGSPAILTEKISLYMALDLKKTETNYDEDEFLEIFEMPLDDAVQAVMSNEIADAKTQICILKAKMWFDKNKED